MPEHTASLWRHRDFRTLWIGATISDFGSAITSLALPMTAVVMLQAGPAHMGVLGAASTMPALLLSLFVGVWVDRVRQRPLLIGADLGRAILIGAIPLSAVGGMLRMEYLYVVSFLASILTLVFDIASTSLLPHIVSRKQLVEGNSKLVLSDSVVSIAGPGVAGNLIDMLTAPLAMLVDAVSFLGSALCLSVIHPHEDTAARAGPNASVWQEMVEGLQWIIKTAPLRAMTLSSGLGSLAISMQQTVFIRFVSCELGLAPTAVGIILASSGVASLLGAFLADKIATQRGPGPAIIWGTSLTCLSEGIIPLTNGPVPVLMALLIGAQCLRGIGVALPVCSNSLLLTTLTMPGSRSLALCVWRGAIANRLLGLISWPATPCIWGRVCSSLRAWRAGTKAWSGSTAAPCWNASTLSGVNWAM